MVWVAGVVGAVVSTGVEEEEEIMELLSTAEVTVPVSNCWSGRLGGNEGSESIDARSALRYSS